MENLHDNVWLSVVMNPNVAANAFWQVVVFFFGCLNIWS